MTTCLRAIRDENLTGMPNAAMTSALEPRDRPAAMEYTAPVPGVSTTTRVVSKKAMLTEGSNSSPEGRTTRYSPALRVASPHMPHSALACAL
jgi:hypothetical protein